MDENHAIIVLARHGFFGYFGPGYTTSHAVDSFMAKHPRGKGIKGFEHDKLELYEACLQWKAARSRVRAYRPL